MKTVKGAGFGVRFYRKAGAGKQMTDKKTTKGKDTPPQEISEPFPFRERQPIIDVPDQTGALSLFETWPPENAATKLAREIQKAKQALQKPEVYIPEVHEWEGAELMSWEKPMMPESMPAKPAPMAMQTAVQKQFTAYKKPPALQAALDKVKAKAEAKKREAEAQQKLEQKPMQKSRVQDITKEVQLWAAAENGDCGKIRMLVMEGVDLDMRDSYGRTALNIAMQYNRKDAIKTIMAAKEMRKMAKDGSLPNMNFFRKIAHEKTGT